MELTNYHSHTVRCQHASGTEEAYVQAAVASGYKVLGFADHTPWPYKSDFKSRIRMTVEEFPDYAHTIRALGEKYKDQIEIPLGLECEAFPEFYGWLSDLKAQYLDYLIIGNHFEPTDERGGRYFGRAKTAEEMRLYLKYTVGAMETGLFSYVAHADLFLRFAPAFGAEEKAISRELCEASKALNVPLEYNLLGVRVHDADVEQGGLGYPCLPFWETVAETGCTAIIGVDAHHTEHLESAQLHLTEHARLESMGINLIERIF